MTERVGVQQSVRCACSMVLASALLASAVGANAAEPTVELPAGASFELAIGPRSSGDPEVKPSYQGTAWIPIELEGDWKPPIRLVLTDVALGAIHDGAWLDRFEVRLTQATEETGHGLALEVALDDGLTQGTYQVSLKLSDAKKPPRLQRLTLLITHPAATLRVPDKLIVRRVLGSAADTRTPLWLQETGRRSGAWPVSLYTIGVPLHGGEPVDRDIRIEFASAGPVGKGSRTEAVPYTITGDLPLGEVSGKLEVSAPQLAAPVEIPFEIETRRSFYWLLGALVIGVVTGHVMRHFIAARIAAGEARQPGLDLVARLNWEYQNTADAVYRSSLANTREELVRALRHDALGDLPGAIEKAETDFDGAREKWHATLLEVKNEIGAFADLLERTWRLPPSIEKIRAHARGALQEAQNRLAGGDAHGTRTFVENALRELSRQARDPGLHWRRNLEEGWALLTGELGRPPAWLAGAAQLREARVREKIGDLNWTDPERPLNEVFAALHSAYYELLDVLGALRRQARVDASRLLRSLRAANGVDSAAITEVEERVEGLATPPIDGDGMQMDRLRAELSALEAAIVRALESGLGSLSADPEKAARDALEKRDLATAAAVIATGAVPPKSPGAQRTSRSAAPPQSGGVAPPTQGPTPGPAISLSPGLHTALREELLGPLHRARVIRTFLVGVPIVWLGFTFLADSFMGTSTQLVTAFLWAYGIDVTADGLAALAKPLVSKMGK